ncbi:MAG TPA: DEAD/DEAH box helicase family protein [Kofleriaceae bacterium]|nr:DEAD/DEAH box helicase family protein [Kofleriaceae bacterium]
MRIRFDRGTLVIDRVEHGHDLLQLLDARYDAELAAWRLPAERLSELRGRLSAGRVPYTDAIVPSALEPRWSLPPLRWYQQAALEAWRDAGDRGVVVLPTGAGTTLVAIAAIAALGVSTLVLVPTRILLDQWARALEQTWPYPIGRLGDGDHRVLPITVATYASAVSWAPRIGDRFGLAIVDEAHHVGAWCPSEVLEMLVAPSRLGLTATPSDSAALPRHIGPLVYDLAIDDLRGDALADYEVETIDIVLEPDERARYSVLRSEFGAFYARELRATPGLSWRELTRIAARSERGREAMAAWRASRALLAYPAGKRRAVRDLLARHPGDRTLVFTADNATAYAIARELLVMPITCDIGRVERAAMIDRFRRGDTPVLVSAQVLDEGFDLPEAEIAIVVGGTGSMRRHVQRVGRLLRPRPGKRARVYELVVQRTAEVSQVDRRRRGLVHHDATEVRA